MGPAVGLALSAWLDREAEWWDAVTVSTPFSTHDQALVVTRAVNQAQP
ncbi:hypothetical protein [Streptomyces albus]|nr:hypothetical protein [Streptomyces albus]UVN59459.1 hypothetical protein NR995_33550 [Streptomyces albus]